MRDQINVMRSQQPPQLHVNIPGLQSSFADMQKRMEMISEDHESIKLENLRLMMHFKTDKQHLIGLLGNVISVQESMDRTL